MKRSPDGLAPIVTLDRRLAKPLHRQLYDGLRDAILEGRLRPGQRLPATRTLARDLRVSRLPVVAAFEQLVDEGYVASRVGAGTFVSSAFPGHRGPRTGAATGPDALASTTSRTHRRRVPRSPLGTLDEPWLERWGPFRVGQPTVDAVAARAWGRLVAWHARRMPERLHAYGDPMGYRPLREALAHYLGTARSVRCDAEQIMITSGSQQGLTVTAHALLEPGDEVWCEEPGYRGARDALLLRGARPVPVPVADDGLDVTAGIARHPQARAAYVTPSHQYPLGVVMSAPCRLRLLDWARRRGAWVIEDDYDSEYRYDAQPIAALQALDADQRVVYVGTLSKVLFPALRLGYLVIPRDLVARFRRVRDAVDIFPPPLHQAALHDFIRNGHLTRHIRRMTAVYAERRRALVEAIRRELGESVRIVGDRAGLHLTLMLPPGADDRDVAVRAAGRGVSVTPLSSCYAGRRRQPGLVLGYAAAPREEIAAAVRELGSVIGA